MARGAGTLDEDTTAALAQLYRAGPEERDELVRLAGLLRTTPRRCSPRPGRSAPPTPLGHLLAQHVCGVLECAERSGHT
ncbi:MAG: hypothetical protein JO100_03050 [Pseudonocardia sp.]|nr:hypothetical protein [Pseudonocardia sp.]